MDLNEWNAALLTDIRARADPERLLYLYIDRDGLARISGQDPEAAVADLSIAVQHFSGRQPFSMAARNAQRWSASGFLGDPAFVAHLAITVLAVTEEPLGGSHGLYRRQNSLLGLPAEPVQPPGYGDDVPVLWRVWNAWLLQPDTKLGKPSARTHPHWRLQGWARSQGLFRHRDRHLIEQFLDDMRLAARNPHHLLARFREWLTYRGAVGADLLARIRDDSAALDVLGDVLLDEARRWEREGPRARLSSWHARALLHFDDWDPKFRGVIPLDSTWHGVPIRDSTNSVYIPDASDEFIVFDLPCSDTALLKDGVEWPIAAGRVVELGGEPVYVFRDEPRVSGRLQTRSSRLGDNCHVLAADGHLARIVAALSAAGTEAHPKRSSVDGWSWIDNIHLDRDSELLRMLGLAAAIPQAVPVPVLSGGLSIASQTYLTGGEPDLTVAIGTPVTVDGVPLRLGETQVRISLADLCLDPGQHKVAFPLGTVRFATVEFAKQAARDGGLAVSIDLSDSGHPIFAEATREPSTTVQLSGARFSGLDVTAPLLMRTNSDSELLVLLETGDVIELKPPRVRWLAAVALQPNMIDVLSAVRTTKEPAAFFLTRHPRSGRMKAVAIPSGVRQLAGTTPSRRRPDLLSQVVSQAWAWQGTPDEARRRTVLNRTLKLSLEAAQPLPAQPQSTLANRTDVDPGSIPNAYDDVLHWLSEREDGRAANEAFARAWEWSCLRRDMPQLAGEWRLAVEMLRSLGHVERDFTRQQVAVAPATVVALPNSAGLSVLAGARPLRLLERLNDVDDDDAVVGDAVSCWSLHTRTALRVGGEPAGPASVYLEWDPDQKPAVTCGLAKLGVGLTGTTSQVLLSMLGPLDRELKHTPPLLMSPGHQMWRWTRRDARWHWSLRADDGPAGFYRYRIASGNRFGWRPEAGGPLLPIEPALGRWLSLRAEGQTALLHHHVVGNLLIVPADLRLPRLLDRALTLRSGLPPDLMIGYRLDERRAPGNYLAYENVDRPAADAAAAVIGQHLQTDVGDIKEHR
jgi:hypothetical protein